jgi:hypothetical protein
MRPAPIIEILSCLALDLELGGLKVLDLSCDRFLAVGIGFEIEWMAWRTLAWPPHHRNSVGFLDF